MILPTFIIGGAPRSGTTFLYHLCDSHPEIYMAKPKVPEPKFFLIHEEYQKGLEYYSKKYFSNAVDFQAIGEKSTNYLEDNQVVHRIKKSLPNVKLVFILRNPVERAYSNYLWSCKNGIETLSFEEALIYEKDRELSYEQKYQYSRPFSYISRGMYANFLKTYLQEFDHSQIKIILFNNIVSEHEFMAKDLFEFIGVSVIPTSLDLDKKVNSAREPDSKMPPYAYEFLRGIYYYPNITN